MADIKLSTIAGGGGGFIAKFASNTIIVSSGATGTYITLTPPSGQRVALTALSSDTGSAQTNLTTVTIGGSDVITGAKLARIVNTIAPVLVDELMIGFMYPNQQTIFGDTDEVVEIKTNVATSQATLYTYQFGE